MSVNMTDNNHDNDLHRRMKAQEKTFELNKQLKKISSKCWRGSRNNDDITGSNHDEEENPNKEPLRLKSQRKVSQFMLVLSKASKLRLHSWLRGMN